MIRSWIAIFALFLGIPGLHGAEDLPAPKVRAADVPALPAPLPGPSVLPQANPNPSGTTPSLPAESSPAKPKMQEQEGPNNSVPDDLKWRYKWHNGQWWYWSPAAENTAERWMIWDRDSWTPYDAATYQAPAGFAKPGPRVVTRNTISVPLPQNYSGSEVSTPPSYSLTPRSTYISPTPYAFGTSSYYGPNGPAASYYNRRSVIGLGTGLPAAARYWAAPYISPRYTAPVGGYLGGRGVSMGFGF